MPEKNTSPKIYLGNQIGEYPIRKAVFKRWLCIILGILLIFTSLLITVFLFFDSWYKVIVNSRAILLHQLPYFMLMLFLILPLGILLLFFSKIFRTKGIYIYEGGMIIDNGFRKHQTDWHNIKRYDNHIKNLKFGSSTIATHVRIIIEEETGKNFTISNHYEQIEKLIEQLRQNILPILFKRANFSLQQGESLSFHRDIDAIRTGIGIRKNFRTWHCVNKPVIKNGLLELACDDEKAKPLHIPVEKIKNLDVLLYLIDSPPIPVASSSPK
jgi:hypothetical protein